MSSPLEISATLIEILSRLTDRELVEIISVNKQFRNVLDINDFWIEHSKHFLHPFVLENIPITYPAKDWYLRYRRVSFDEEVLFENSRIFYMIRLNNPIIIEELFARYKIDLLDWMEQTVGPIETIVGENLTAFVDYILKHKNDSTFTNILNYLVEDAMISGNVGLMERLFNEGFLPTNTAYIGFAFSGPENMLKSYMILDKYGVPPSNVGLQLDIYSFVAHHVAEYIINGKDIEGYRKVFQWLRDRGLPYTGINWVGAHIPIEVRENVSNIINDFFNNE